MTLAAADAGLTSGLSSYNDQTNKLRIEWEISYILIRADL
jgi:hypothetical protein